MKMADENVMLYGEDYSIRAQKLIIWFFRLLLIFVLLTIILLFTVRINDTVSFTQGEIISQNPQIDLKAPFEAQLSKIYVREGQKVNTGDTLMVIYNEANARAYVARKAEQEYLGKKLVSLRTQLNALGKKKSETGAESNINGSNHNLAIQNINNSIQALEVQYKLQQQKLNIALERYRADSILYKKDMLSKIEYNTSADLVNNIQESLNTIKNQLQQQRTQQNVSANDFQSKQHQVVLRNIELEESNQSLHQVQIDLENALTKVNEDVELLSHELSKQYLIAPTNGVVNFIFTSKLSTNLINKSDLLLSISPDKNDFYAKVILPEHNIQYVKTTMPAHLQLDAYYHLEYGIIQGTVTYISARKESEKFYALIKLNNAKNFQLKPGYNVSGEVITDRSVLIRYLIKKLFKEFDKKPA
jgi:hemolysin D